MELALERFLRVPPERVWPWIAEPELMSRWSEARIVALLPGDGGHPGATGATREVQLPSGPLREMIAESVAPTHVVYAAFDAPLVLEHRGVQELTPAAGGTTLRWTVRARLASGILDRAMELALARSVGRSLDALVRWAERENVVTLPFPPMRTLEEEAALPVLASRARETRDAQNAWADRLLEKGDDRGWFPRVYALVTDEILAAVERGSFLHPAWVLRLVLAFHPLWEDALARRLGLGTGAVPAHWRRGHAVAERAKTWAWTPYQRAVFSIFGGMRAHIEGDLPIAMARVHRESYAGRADLARFRADYLRLAPVFHLAGERIQKSFARHELGLPARVLDRLTPGFLRPSIIDGLIYPITRERGRAFARAERLVA